MKEFLIYVMCFVVIGAPIWAVYDLFLSGKIEPDDSESDDSPGSGANETNSAFYLYDAENDRW